MDASAARIVSHKLQISVDAVVREEYEVLLLKELFESDFGAHIMFKGGTALRLAYGSPRFSEDLDFTALRDLDADRFTALLKQAEKRYPSFLSIDTREKFYTLFAIARVKEDFLTHPLTIRIEISKRSAQLVKDRDFTERVIASQATPLTVLARVASLELILREKEDALKNRQAARDVFDYWFINQLLKRNVNIDLSGYDRHQVRSELHRLLPKSYWRVVDLWLG